MPVKYQLISGDGDDTPRTTLKRIKSLRWKAFLALFVVAIFSGFTGSLLAPRLTGKFMATSCTCNVEEFSNSDVPLSLIDHIFTYNKTFGADPKNEPESQAYWDSIIPVGRGTVQYPSESRNFATLSVVHQLHCLWSIHRAFFNVVNGNLPGHGQTLQHMRHCFDYLRQGIMCASDTTLEPVDPVLRGVTGWGVLRKCRNYEDAMQWAEERRSSNMRGFKEDTHIH